MHYTGNATYDSTVFDRDSGMIAIEGMGWFSIQDIFNMASRGEIPAEMLEDLEIPVEHEGFLSLKHYVERYGASYPPEDTAH